jgi:hypothetical protein
MHPNAKEIARADNGYTAVVRPNKDKGGWNVAIVNIQTCKPVFQIAHVERKEDIAQALASDLRMMDKCGFKCNLATSSRQRNF